MGHRRTGDNNTRDTQMQELKDRYMHLWLKEQRDLRSRMDFRDVFDWKTPAEVKCTYYTVAGVKCCGIVKRIAKAKARVEGKKKAEIKGEMSSKKRLRKKARETVTAAQRDEIVDELRKAIVPLLGGAEPEPGSELSDLLQRLADIKLKATATSKGDLECIEETKEQMPESALHTADDSVVCKAKKRSALQLVGGVGMSEFWDKQRCVFSICVMQYPSRKVVYSDTRVVKFEMPYIPHFRAFREEKPLLDLICALKKKAPRFVPDVLLISGHGYFHKERCSVASQIGVKCGLPTIGVARKPLYIPSCNPTAVQLHMEKMLHRPGEFENIYSVPYRSRRDAERTDRVAAGLRLSKEAIVYVSVGNAITLDTALEVVYLVSNFKEAGIERPEPLERAYQCCIAEKQRRSGRGREPPRFEPGQQRRGRGRRRRY